MPNYWLKISPEKRLTIQSQISLTLKAKGIRPPSNKGKKFSSEHVQKIIASKRANGSLYHTRERTARIQAARKIFYDRNGRISTLVERLKTSQKYKVWRQKVFERDAYTCVLCHKYGRYIEADHIIPKSHYLKLCEYNYDRCMKYEPLWDITNGRTLCKKCHINTPTFANGAKHYE